MPVFRANIEFVAVPGWFDALAIAIGDEFLAGLQCINRIRITLDHGERVAVEA